MCGAVSEEDLAMKHFTRTIGASPDTPKTAFAEINAAHQAKTIKKPNCNKKKAVVPLRILVDTDQL